MDTTTSPRILVIGAGVNGSLCAVALQRAGVDVTLLARGARAEAVRRDGLVLEDPMTAERSVTRVKVLTELQADDVYDYLLVVVRRSQVDALLPVLARNRSPAVVFMVNTVEGPQAWCRALGAQRVLLGFVFGAGRREGDLVRVYRPRRARAPFGEVDGRLTPRVERLVALLSGAGLGAYASATLPDWLTTHAAMVAPLGAMILKHGCDPAALARSPEDLRLLAGAMAEVVGVLKATGHQVLPASNAALAWLPRWLLVAALRALFRSRLGEVGAAWHCSQAPEELAELALELRELVDRSGLAVPALRHALALRPVPRAAAASPQPGPASPSSSPLASP